MQLHFSCVIATEVSMKPPSIMIVPSRPVKKWLLKYQHLFSILYETETLADWLYQRTKFKSDRYNYDYHRLQLLKGNKFSFVKGDNNKAGLSANSELNM
jgi:hypothetical protein